MKYYSNINNYVFFCCDIDILKTTRKYLNQKEQLLQNKLINYKMFTRNTLPDIADDKRNNCRVNK
jgi:hypothetical protein